MDKDLKTHGRSLLTSIHEKMGDLLRCLKQHFKSFSQKEQEDLLKSIRVINFLRKKKNLVGATRLLRNKEDDSKKCDENN